MVIFHQGGSENSDFLSRWFRKFDFSVEVVPKMVIFYRGGSENGDFPSRCFRRLYFSVEVVPKIVISVEAVLKMVISCRGDAANCHLSRFKIPIRICYNRFEDFLLRINLVFSTWLALSGSKLLFRLCILFA